MKEKTWIIILLIVVAVALWAFGTGKLNTGDTTFFAGAPAEDVGVVRYYEYYQGCTTDTQCVDIAIEMGAPPDVEVYCKEDLCYAKAIVGGGSQ